LHCEGPDCNESIWHFVLCLLVYAYSDTLNTPAGDRVVLLNDTFNHTYDVSGGDRYLSNVLACERSLKNDLVPIAQDIDGPFIFDHACYILCLAPHKHDLWHQLL